MKNSCLSVLSLCLAVSFAGNSASAALNLVDVSGNTVVFDNVTSLYWYQDLGDFSFLDYADQLTAISSLNSAPAHAGLTSWHMAERSEMEGLYVNGADAIMNAFLTDEEGEWLGRYFEAAGASEQYIGGVKDEFGLVDLGTATVTSQCTHSWLSVWAVASTAPSYTPPSVPAPGGIALVLTGIGSSWLGRRRRGNKIASSGNPQNRSTFC